MRSRDLVVVTAVVLLAAASGFAFSDVHAMPGFARKYKLSCSTCHAPFPRLKPYGEEFAARGFRAEEEPERATYDVGDPLLLLPREIPIGIRFEGFVSYKEDAAADFDQEFPWVWKILSGGPLSDTAAYYFYFLVERGEVAGLEDAYLQVNRIFGSPIDFVIGQFQVSDPMFKRETRLEREDYEIYRTRVGESSLNLTYERGIILAWDAPGEVETLIQIVNGNGIGHVDGARNFDRDGNKNPVLRLARTFGEVRVGGIGYYGLEDGPENGSEDRENETLYFGGDLSATFGGRGQINLQYLERRDDNPFFAADPGDDVETRGGFVELHYFPQGENGRWALSGLYNRVDSDDDPADRESAAVTANYLLARNLRVLAEAGYDIEGELGRFTAGLVAAF